MIFPEIRKRILAVDENEFHLVPLPGASMGRYVVFALA